MAEKPAAPSQDGARSVGDESPTKKDQDFRLLCRRYARMRARPPG